MAVNTEAFQIFGVDHTGITVSDIEKAMRFWCDVLGFELSHRAHHRGELASEVTGVEGAEILIAVLKGQGHKIELLQYVSPADGAEVRARPCDVGSAHVALAIDDLEPVLERMAAHGWRAAGRPQTLSSGPNAGRQVVYTRDPDGTIIELMTLPAGRTASA